MKYRALPALCAAVNFQGDSSVHRIVMHAHGAIESILVYSMKDFFATQPYLEKGFKLLVKAAQADPDFMSWAGPFSFGLWMVVRESHFPNLSAR